jgi:hypothetical protein
MPNGRKLARVLFSARVPGPNCALVLRVIGWKLPGGICSAAAGVGEFVRFLLPPSKSSRKVKNLAHNVRAALSCAEPEARHH